MGNNLKERPGRRWFWGRTIVVGRKPDDSIGLYSQEDRAHIGKRMAMDEARLASLQRGARAGNPVAAEVLMRELRLRVYMPMEIAAFERSLHACAATS